MIDLSQVNSTLGAIIAAFTLLSLIGGAVVWALATKFATKALVYAVRDKLSEQRDAARKEAELKLEVWCTKIELDLKNAAEMASECNRRHELAKQPFATVVEVLREMKEDLKSMNARAEARDHKLIEAIQNIDKRLVVVEHAPRPRRAGPALQT